MRKLQRATASRAGRRNNDIVLRPVHPNAGIEAAYRQRLTALVEAMNKSVRYWLEAAYKANEPVMAQDETPAAALRAAMRKLAKQWQANFDEAASDLAGYFATAASKRSDAALRAILKKGGFSVEFRATPAARDILQATVAQNVALIKSIPAQYLTNVEGLVMRSVQTGRDLGQLTKDLQAQFGVTRRRAAFIARDQNNRATGAMIRARQDELGITEAIWQHSGGGRHPRPTHIANSGKKYDIGRGWYDPAVGKHVLPGELPNCRCVSKSVIPGFN